MAFIRKIFGGTKKKKETRKDSVTGRNHSWPVPYLSRLEGTQLQPGQSLIVRGFVTGTDRFDVNLTTGPSVDGQNLDNHVLHLSCRITERRIVMNSLVDGQWGKEKRIKCPFREGDEFDFRVRAQDSHFEVFVDHRLATKYEYRLPLTSITHIFIKGDCEMYTVSWEGKYYSVPYAADIPGNFYPGRKLYVSGIPAKKSKSFSIDLHSGNDIAFHFNPRFSEKAVIRNTRCDGTWGKEERTGDFPFNKKLTFDIILYCEEAQFRCYVDGCLFATYNHRMSPRNIDKLAINGDLDLQGVHLK